MLARSVCTLWHWCGHNSGHRRCLHRPAPPAQNRGQTKNRQRSVCGIWGGVVGAYIIPERHRRCGHFVALVWAQWTQPLLPPSNAPGTKTRSDKITAAISLRSSGWGVAGGGACISSKRHPSLRLGSSAATYSPVATAHDKRWAGAASAPRCRDTAARQK